MLPNYWNRCWPTAWPKEKETILMINTATVFKSNTNRTKRRFMLTNVKVVLYTRTGPCRLCNCSNDKITSEICKNVKIRNF